MDMEEQIINNMEKEDFFKLLKKNSILLSNVSIKKKEYNEDYFKFNILVSGLVEESKFTVFDIALFLFEDYFHTVTDVMSCFDENNLYNLKMEGEEIYHRDSFKNTLDNFLYI